MSEAKSEVESEANNIVEREVKSEVESEVKSEVKSEVESEVESCSGPHGLRAHRALDNCIGLEEVVTHVSQSLGGVGRLYGHLMMREAWDEAREGVGDL